MHAIGTGRRSRGSWICGDIEPWDDTSFPIKQKLLAKHLGKSFALAGRNLIQGPKEKRPIMAAPKIERFVEQCLAQKGDKYVFAAEAAATDPNPEAFDCSELVEWACVRLGVPMVDGSMNQRALCQSNGTMISVEKALRTRGALLFRDKAVTNVGHVAVSLGVAAPAQPLTIEARGSAFGVGVFDGRKETRLWTEGAKIAGFDYTAEELRPPMSDRLVVFGRHGGRVGHVNAALLDDRSERAKALDRFLDLIAEADERHRIAVVVHREEPKRLEDVKGPEYPRFLVEKASSAD